jgi:hypothetical protein
MPSFGLKKEMFYGVSVMQIRYESSFHSETMISFDGFIFIFEAQKEDSNLVSKTLEALNLQHDDSAVRTEWLVQSRLLLRESTIDPSFIPT